MHSDLRQAIETNSPSMQRQLETLVAIPSVSASGFDPIHVLDSAKASAAMLAEVGLQNVRLLEGGDALPSVFGEIPAPPGAPTVLLYAHHDVQPPGDLADWDHPPFQPIERARRLYGRGTCDDKWGVVTHAAALAAHGGAPPVGVKVFLEGEEEIGSPHLNDFFGRHGDLFAADVIVIADGWNWRVGKPSLVTSLRGLVDCVVEVRTAADAVHSGLFGGPFPDALTVLSRLLATLHHADGRVAVPGRTAADSDPLDLAEAELRQQIGVVGSLELIGTGTLTSRLWTRPSISVLAIDAPRVAEAVNQLVPVARAKVSMRLAPGDDPARAMAALVDHLESNAPWGAEVRVTPGASALPFSLPTQGPVLDRFRIAQTAAWGIEPVLIGGGGTIPVASALTAAYPAAAVVITGAADPGSRMHGPNESVDLGEVGRAALAEAIALRLLAD